MNEQFLLQLGLHPAAGQKPTQTTPPIKFEDWAKGGSVKEPAVKPKPLPPITEKQRKLAELSQTFQEVRPPRTTEERIQRAATAQGVPADVFRRPLTDFEVRLRIEGTVQLVHPERGIPTPGFSSMDFSPLADPDTGKIIGYVNSRSDSLICDVLGNIQQWSDTPVTPSAVQLDDLILVGGTLVKGGGKLLVLSGSTLARSAVGRRVSNRLLNRLRAAAAAAMMGTARPAPILGGELGARAAATLERRVAAEAVEETGARAVTRAPGPIVGATEVRVTQAQLKAALRHAFPSQYLNPITRTVEGIGQRAARRAVANPRFVQAIQQRNWTLAGTLFHSAAAAEARKLPASALPAGWKLEAERTLKSGLGGGRADILLSGPGGQIAVYDWKTSAISALSASSRREMTKHAGLIATNVGGTLTVQESRTWIDFVRNVRPDLFR